MRTIIATASFFQLLCISFSVADSPYAPSSLRTLTDNNPIATYHYDTSGGRLTGSYDGQNYTIGFGLLGKPESIETGDGPEIFKYANNGSRYLRNNAQGVKTLYVGDMEYRIENGVAHSVYYIHNNTYRFIAQVETAGTTNLSYTYYLSDHQGTALQEVNENGQPQNYKRYDPWGLRVNVAGSALDKKDIDEKSRSFTSYETIQSAGLFHAKGRVYDPLVGFVAPDPVLFSNNLVSHNRYAFTLNSPLNYVDVNGYAPFTMSALKRAQKWGMDLESYYKFVEKQFEKNSGILSNFDIKVMTARRKRFKEHIKSSYQDLRVKKFISDKETAERLAVKTARNRIDEEDALALALVTPLDEVAPAIPDAARLPAAEPLFLIEQNSPGIGSIHSWSSSESIKLSPLNSATAFDRTPPSNVSRTAPPSLEPLHLPPAATQETATIHGSGRPAKRPKVLKSILKKPPPRIP